jgi:hypothetical protein
MKTLIIVLIIAVAIGVALFFLQRQTSLFDPFFTGFVDPISAAINNKLQGLRSAWVADPFSVILPAATAAGSVATIAGLIIGQLNTAKQKAETTANEAQQQTGQIFGELNKAERTITEKDKLIIDLQKQLEAAGPDVATITQLKSRITELENSVSGYRIQNEQLMATLENRPVQIIETTTVK